MQRCRECKGRGYVMRRKPDSYQPRPEEIALGLVREVAFERTPCPSCAPAKPEALQ